MTISYRNPRRSYRSADIQRNGEQKFQIVVEESDLWITIPRGWAQARDAALEAVRRLRGEIAAWCEALPAFRHGLSPLPAGAVPDRAPAVVRSMDEAARRMGVGPFAAVAGAIAQAVADELADDLTRRGLPADVLVENGGDLYLHSTRERIVGLLADPESGGHVGLRLDPGDFPVSICASSATIGHSLSFGRGELTVVRGPGGSLADAAATAYGNMLRGPDDVDRVLARAARDAGIGVDGVYAQCSGKIGIWGRMELAVIRENAGRPAGE